MGEKRYFIDLDGTGLCRIRVLIKTSLGQVVDLVIQLEMFHENNWVAVARYDCAHGTPHLDLLHKERVREKKLFKKLNLDEMVDLAINDFKDNWEEYLRRLGYENEEKK